MTSKILEDRCGVIIFVYYCILFPWFFWVDPIVSEDAP